MGGYGSGRERARATVEGSVALDIRWLARQGNLSLSVVTIGSFTWSRAGKEIASIGLTVQDDGLKATAVELSYIHMPEGGRAEDVRYHVPLEYTRCHMGGTRPWFICPGVADGRACNRRVAVLYLRSKYFLCRHCQRLYYSSQSESRCDRALNRSTKIRKRIGAQPGPAHPVLWKPRHMHWRTFQRQVAKLREVEDVYHEESCKQLTKLLGRFERVTPADSRR